MEYLIVLSPLLPIQLHLSLPPSSLDGQYVILDLVDTLCKQCGTSRRLSPYNAAKTPQENSQCHDDDSVSYDDDNRYYWWQDQIVLGIQ